jgi:hypothetical protein
MAEKPTCKELLSIPEFCRENEICRTATYSEINAGRLHAVKRGRRTFIPREAAEEWRKSLPPYEPKSAA